MEIYVRQEHATGRQQILFETNKPLVWFDQSTRDEFMTLKELLKRPQGTDPDFGRLLQTFADRGYDCGIITMMR